MISGIDKTPRSILFCTFVEPACGTLLQSREEQERMLALMDQRLDERDFRIDIDYMMPLHGGGRRGAFSGARVSKQRFPWILACNEMLQFK